LTWWTDYQARRGQDRKTLYTNNMKNLISTEFENSTSYNLVTINNISRDVRIVEESSIIKNPNRKRLLCKPDETITVGDIVVWDSENWICVMNDTTSQISDVGIIQKCNNTLNFYDKNSILYEINCIVGKGSISLDENKIITTVDSEISLTVSNTLITQQIKVNDIYKLGLKSYVISSVGDDITIPGLLIFELKYNEIEQVLPVFSIEILNGSAITREQGSTLQLNVQVSADNVVISPTPTITYASSDITKVTVSTSGLITAIANGNCTITATSNGVSDTISVTVTASIEDDDYSVVITGSESIKINKTASYVAEIYNNGIIATGINVVWSLVGSYASITSQDGDSCVITAGATSGNSVTLRATKSDEITIYKNFEIDIVGLW